MASSSSSLPSLDHVAPALSAIQVNPNSAIAVTALLLGGGLLWIQSSGSLKTAAFPRLANQTVQQFQSEPLEVIAKGRVLHKDKPFIVMTAQGPVTVLSPELGHALRNDPNLSFNDAAKDLMQSHLPGFEPFGASDKTQGLMQNVARKQLTKSLSRITGPLSVEASFAIDLNFGSSTTWRPIHPYPDFLDVVARLSSRVFLGEKLCRDEAWLNITKSYTTNSFEVARELNNLPPWMRRFANAWLIPKSRLIRQQLVEATALIKPVIEERKRQQGQDKTTKQRVPDAIDWFQEESAGAPYDAGIMQLIMSVAAIHTTTDLLTETMLRLAQEPEFVEELRAEIKSVLQAEGAWTKMVLFNLKSLDSAIKEAQRLRPNLSASMMRRVMAPVTIPGTDYVLPKGSQLVVSTHLRLDADTYEQPHKYIGGRFAELRSKESNKLPVHLVSTGVSSLGFGHGNHACPGRFFAANEIKVALCHLLIKYDWKVAPDQDASVKFDSSGVVDMSPITNGVSLGVNTSIKLLFRKRTPEEMGIDLDAIGTDKEEE
ncbi:cytochrome P450 monooxygenase 2 [Microdochium nivale]|nr:cytochrome P450 monooxygenase 2 [Microdochium nivale]